MASVARLSAILGKMVVAAGLGLFLAVAPVSAAPDWKLVELRSALAELSSTLRSGGDLRAMSVSDLVQGLDWSLPHEPKRPVVEFAEPEEPGAVGWTDMRFALAAMSQVYGGTDDYDVLQAARGKDTEALEIQSGVVTMSQLRKRLTNRHLGWEFERKADLLRVPVVIGRDATLRLGPDDILQLSRNDGAFIVNFGRLEIFGAEVFASTEPNERNDEFAPFIASVGSGSVHISGAKLSHLGFGHTAKFAGLAIVAYPTLRPTNRSVIEHSRFEELVTVAVVGTANAELLDNRFFDMRRNPLLISRSPNALIEGNLFSGPTPTNAVRISNGSDGARLIGNVVLEGSRVGLLVASGSDNVSVEGNLIWRRNGGGVKLHGVSCARIEKNLILDDKQKGIEVRSSDNTYVHGNKIVGNKNAGVWVSAQKRGSVTYVTDNLLRENGSGFSTAAGAKIALKGNDLSNQFPRLLDGDITQQFRAIIADLRGQTPILLDAGGSWPTDTLAPASCGI